VDWNSILQSAGVSAIVVAIVGGLFLRANRRAEAKSVEASAGKTNAETEGLITKAARDVVRFYKDEFADLTARVERAEDKAEAVAAELNAVKAHVEHLERVMVAEGLEPPSRPVSWKAG
jgi:hypothetical protein